MIISMDFDNEEYGRWMAERTKHIIGVVIEACEKENYNVITCSPDAASMIAMAGDLVIDLKDERPMYVGKLDKIYDVFVDVGLKEFDISLGGSNG